MSEQYNFDKMIEGQGEHYSDKSLLRNLKSLVGIRL